MKTYDNVVDKIMIACATLAIVLLLLLGLGGVSFCLWEIYTNISNVEEGKTENYIPIIYDSNVIQESDLFCPFCGEPTTAMNNEVVCRNEACDRYGLPVVIYDVLYNNEQ